MIQRQLLNFQLIRRYRLKIDLQKKIVVKYLVDLIVQLI